MAKQDLARLKEIDDLQGKILETIKTIDKSFEKKPQKITKEENV